MFITSARRTDSVITNRIRGFTILASTQVIYTITKLAINKLYGY